MPAPDVVNDRQKQMLVEIVSVGASRKSTSTHYASFVILDADLIDLIQKGLIVVGVVDGVLAALPTDHGKDFVKRLQN